MWHILRIKDPENLEAIKKVFKKVLWKSHLNLPPRDNILMYNQSFILYVYKHPFKKTNHATYDRWIYLCCSLKYKKRISSILVLYPIQQILARNLLCKKQICNRRGTVYLLYSKSYCCKVKESGMECLALENSKKADKTWVVKKLPRYIHFFNKYLKV